ncbi:hypothetical protein P8452_47141 [Trifolium repens]|nr:zinc finger (C2H2 type) family protein [Trifolium repens]WJX62110.1 hypothetical protein P8452_47141 [Trifolium repens]
MICLGIKKSIKFTLTGMNGSVDIAKKSFRDEKFIDQHIDNRHYNLLDLDQGSFFRLAAGALILVLLPVFYLFLYLIKRRVEIKSFVASPKLDGKQSCHDC